MIQAAVLGYGNEEQKKRYLPELVTGKFLGAFSLSESGSGSDASSLRTSAKRVSGGYEINGTKLWCSNGCDADLFLVMARTGEPGPKGISAFLITKDLQGFRIGKKEKKLGLRASSLTELIFENCVVPEANRLGIEGEGFTIALSQLDAGRIGIAATALGLAQQSLESIWSQGTHSKAFEWGHGTKGLWAKHYASLQAVFSLLLLTAQEKEKGNQVTALASQCKLLASDLAMQMTSLAVETAGPEGVSADSALARMMRDAKALQIVEGTSQIQQLVLSREIDKMVMK
jgi:alkylation response protein AidB-like acyl-CoA dehydrogenase